MSNIGDILSKQKEELLGEIREREAEYSQESGLASEHNRRATALRNEILRLNEVLTAINKTGEVSQ